MTHVAAGTACPSDADGIEGHITLIGHSPGRAGEAQTMHPDMLGQMVQLEHTRRLQSAELAAALRTFDDEDEAGIPARRPGRVARLLAMRAHRHDSPAGANAAPMA
ncbi:MAG TPA: hypothetical protein VI316_03690 [Candidatus Dormibacteraeota bacterium]